MLPAMRDVLAVQFLERRLGEVRERQLRRALEGHPPTKSELREEGERIHARMRELFYSEETRVLMGLEDAQDITDEEDFEGRSTLVAEQALFMTHERLLSIPFVGRSSVEG